MDARRRPPVAVVQDHSEQEGGDGGDGTDRGARDAARLVHAHPVHRHEERDEPKCEYMHAYDGQERSTDAGCQNRLGKTQRKHHRSEHPKRRRSNLQQTSTKAADIHIHRQHPSVSTPPQRINILLCQQPFDYIAWMPRGWIWTRSRSFAASLPTWQTFFQSPLAAPPCAP